MSGQALHVFLASIGDRIARLGDLDPGQVQWLLLLTASTGSAAIYLLLAFKEKNWRISYFFLAVFAALEVFAFCWVQCPSVRATVAAIPSHMETGYRVARAFIGH